MSDAVVDNDRADEVDETDEDEWPHAYTVRLVLAGLATFIVVTLGVVGMMAWRDVRESEHARDREVARVEACAAIEDQILLRNCVSE